MALELSEPIIYFKGSNFEVVGIGRGWRSKCACKYWCWNVGL